MSESANGFSISNRSQEHMCLLAQEVVFDKGSDLLAKLLGIDMSAKQLLRVSESYGAILEQKDRDAIASESGLKKEKQTDLTYVMEMFP
jgi:hypothetical protein